MDNIVQCVTIYGLAVMRDLIQLFKWLLLVGWEMGLL